MLNWRILTARQCRRAPSPVSEGPRPPLRRHSGDPPSGPAVFKCSFSFSTPYLRRRCARFTPFWTVEGLSVYVRKARGPPMTWRFPCIMRSPSPRSRTPRIPRLLRISRIPPILRIPRCLSRPPFPHRSSYFEGFPLHTSETPSGEHAPPPLSQAFLPPAPPLAPTGHFVLVADGSHPCGVMPVIPPTGAAPSDESASSSAAAEPL